MKLMKKLYNFFIYNTESDGASYKNVEVMLDSWKNKKRAVWETIDILFWRLYHRVDSFIYNRKNDLYLLKHRYERFEYDYMYYTRLPKLVEMLRLRKADLHSGVPVSFMFQYGFDPTRELDATRAFNLFNLYLDVMIRGFELQLRNYDDCGVITTKEEEEEIEYGLRMYKELLTML